METTSAKRVSSATKPRDTKLSIRSIAMFWRRKNTPAMPWNTNTTSITSTMS